MIPGGHHGGRKQTAASAEATVTATAAKGTAANEKGYLFTCAVLVDVFIIINLWPSLYIQFYGIMVILCSICAKLGARVSMYVRM